MKERSKQAFPVRIPKGLCTWRIKTARDSKRRAKVCRALHRLERAAPLLLGVGNWTKERPTILCLGRIAQCNQNQGCARSPGSRAGLRASTRPHSEGSDPPVCAHLRRRQTPPAGDAPRRSLRHRPRIAPPRCKGSSTRHTTRTLSSLRCPHVVVAAFVGPGTTGRGGQRARGPRVVFLQRTNPTGPKKCPQVQVSFQAPGTSA